MTRHRKKPARQALSIANHHKLVLGLMLVASIAIGYVVFKILAASPSSVVNTASGTVSAPAAAIPDSTAAGGSAVQFKAAQTAHAFCGNPPTGNKIDTIIVIAEENHSWSGVGGTGFGSMPYLKSIANECSYFTLMDDTEPNPQNSATQYVGAWTGFGSAQTHVTQDCDPSPSCSTTLNNIFRAYRAVGVPRREYVEGATSNCATGTKSPAKHIPDLYMWDPTDRVNCVNEVLPLTQLNWANPPTGFSFITPNLDNDAHDGTITAADNWLKDPSRLPAVFNSPQYKAGKVLVESWWDEERPKPNLFACWSCAHNINTNNPTYAGESRLWLNLLGGSPANLGAISSAIDIRPQIGTP